MSLKSWPGMTMPSTTFKDDAKSTVNEFVGTVIFLTLALGGIQSAKLTVVANQGVEVAENGPLPLELWIYISLTMGLSLLASVWMFYRVTGGLFNPSVTLALALAGCINLKRLVMYIIAQMIGGIVASAIVLGLTPGPFLVGCDLSEGINAAQGVFIEIFANAFFILSILMLAAEKSAVTPMAPIGIGLTFFACHLFAAPLTGSALNPARAFGPAVVTSFPGIHWVYWVGPGLGACLASSFYAWLKYVQYWTINPGQDATEACRADGYPAQKGHEKDPGASMVRGHSHETKAETVVSGDHMV